MKNSDKKRFSLARVLPTKPLGVAAFLGLLLCGADSAFSQGIALRGVSAVNEGMAGVATATPVDALGSLHWNPASIAAYEKSNMTMGSAIILARSSVESGIDLSKYGGPKLSGETESNTGAVPAPHMGFIMKDEANPQNPFTLGFSLAAIGGAQLNYPGDLSNPILNPNIGFGRASAKVEIFQMTPTLACQLTERISVGIAPSILIGRLIAEPLFFGPTDAAGDWSGGAGTRYNWGAGFQAGLYIKGDAGFNYGVSYKSPQWIEDFEYEQMLDGVPNTATFELDYPPIYSIGMSYDGFERTIIGVDARYFDYDAVVGFSDLGYNADGSIVGLGWKSVFSVATAIQHKLNDQLAVRCGYCFNTNPIESEAALTNVPAPMIMQHSLNAGATLTTTNEWIFSVGYAHAFDNSVEGQLSPLDPNSYVKSTAGADSISFSVGKNF